MPRINVYLPQDLYDRVKAEDLPVSEILQAALRARLELDEKLRAADEFVAMTIAEYGEPSEEDERLAEESAQRILEHARRMGKIGPRPTNAAA
ncbi:MAG TPA: hypothetical protein VGJ53_03115 [Micromonosporaceae bacterium]